MSLPVWQPLRPNARGIPSLGTRLRMKHQPVPCQGVRLQRGPGVQLSESSGRAPRAPVRGHNPDSCLPCPLPSSVLHPQGKSFIKDALRCKAHALRHRFGCISRKCPAIREMVLQLQRECYLKHDLCAAARHNTRVMVEMIHFKDLLLRE